MQHHLTIGGNYFFPIRPLRFPELLDGPSTNPPPLSVPPKAADPDDANGFDGTFPNAEAAAARGKPTDGLERTAVLPKAVGAFDIGIVDGRPNDAGEADETELD